MHSIRLRHPWQCESTQDGVCWSRSFNWPAGIGPRESAWLVIEGLPALATVALSGKPLTGDESGRFEVTELLALHNRLTIEIPDGTLTDETECPYNVRLEICEMPVE